MALRLEGRNEGRGARRALGQEGEKGERRGEVANSSKWLAGGRAGGVICVVDARAPNIDRQREIHRQTHATALSHSACQNPTWTRRDRSSNSTQHHPRQSFFQSHHPLTLSYHPPAPPRSLWFLFRSFCLSFSPPSFARTDRHRHSGLNFQHFNRQSNPSARTSALHLDHSSFTTRSHPALVPSTAATLPPQTHPFSL